ncbi:hypothetical protein KPL70_020165 [Citrus sinensis]|nr:hypothetical protein KPL70_020165 [Citrus sinensis]
MEEDKQSVVKGIKEPKKRRLISSTNHAGLSNCSPEYVRSRSSTNRRTAILDTDTAKLQKALQFKNEKNKRKVSKELFPSTKGKGELVDQQCRVLRKGNPSCTEHLKGNKQTPVFLKTRWPTGWYSDDERDTLADVNDDQQQLEGYSSEKEKDNLYGLVENQLDEYVVLYHGQRFKDVTQFRNAIQVYAIREQFKLCIMENRSHIVSCECSDLSCDWQVTAIRDVRGKGFVITQFSPKHNCPRLDHAFHPASKWISAMFLHRWKEQPSISTTEVRNEIESMYGIKCPEWKVFCAANRAKQILGLDYDDGYAMLHQFKEEMERIDRDNIVLVETETHESREEERFKRVFVCCARTSYAFKVHCRGILAVDGWEINNPCNSVMLVAAGLDGNNGILPVAFCEVQVEDLDSWVYFLKNINSALRLENGKGLCILGDGDNGVEYAVEEFLPRAVYRQCCHRIFNEMVRRFPTAPVQHLFWSACRTTSATRFYNYMELISLGSQECHDWLKNSNWERWALFCMPHWVKCTCVTLTITEKLRTSFDHYLEMSITRRFTAIARSAAEIFERRRMVVWKWYREKVTPTVQDIIHDRCSDGRRFIVRKQTGTLLELTDSCSSCYELNMDAMSCSCGLWQISGIPCAHACKGIKYMRRKIEDYVDSMMSVQNYMSTYAPGMMQLPQEYAWKWDAGHTLLPPISLPLKPISAKGTDDLTSNKHLLHVADQYLTPTRNLQVHLFLTQLLCIFALHILKHGYFLRKLILTPSLQWTQDMNSSNSSEHTSLLRLISTTSSDTISKDSL